MTAGKLSNARAMLAGKGSILGSTICNLWNNYNQITYKIHAIYTRIVTQLFNYDHSIVLPSFADILWLWPSNRERSIQRSRVHYNRADSAHWILFWDLMRSQIVPIFEGSHNNCGNIWRHCCESLPLSAFTNPATYYNKRCNNHCNKHCNNV